jgi:hypothetical protein
LAELLTGVNTALLDMPATPSATPLPFFLLLPPPCSTPKTKQAFAAPAKLAELVTGVNTAMRERLPPTVAKTRLYLPNPATRAILFRPIKSNIAEAHGQIAQLLEAEYGPEEAAQVPLLQPDALKEALDELS